MYSQQDNYKDATHCLATIRLQILSRVHFLPSLPSTQIQGRDRCWSWNHGFESKLWNGHCQKRTIMRQEEFILIIIMDNCLSVNCIWKRERKHCCGQLYLWVCRFVFEEKNCLPFFAGGSTSLTANSDCKVVFRLTQHNVFHISWLLHLWWIDIDWCSDLFIIQVERQPNLCWSWQRSLTSVERGKENALVGSQLMKNFISLCGDRRGLRNEKVMRKILSLSLYCPLSTLRSRKIPNSYV